jgi:hypothetical protein
MAVVVVVAVVAVVAVAEVVVVAVADAAEAPVTRHPANNDPPASLSGDRFCSWLHESGSMDQRTVGG